MPDAIVSANPDNINNLVDGQIYRWQWRDEAMHHDGLTPWGAYHCKSRIAVVRNGRLIDTFWGDMSPEHAVRVDDVHLTLCGDMAWPELYSGQERYYDPADICDMRHSNDTRASIYLRPGAKRKEAAILQVIEELEAEAERLKRHAERVGERATEARELLRQGRLDEVTL